MFRLLKYCLLFTLALSAHDISAQGHKYLMLEKGRSLKKVRIYPGSELRFKFQGDKHFYTRKIKDLLQDIIVFENSVIKVNEIAEIDISGIQNQSSLITGLGKKLPIAGAGYFLVDQFNTSVVNGQSLRIDRKVLRTSTIMIGIGLLFGLTTKSSIKINERNRLRIINLLPEENNKN